MKHKKVGRKGMKLLCRGSGCDQGRGIVIVTHDHRLRSIADRVLWLEDGQLANGTERLDSLPLDA